MAQEKSRAPSPRTDTVRQGLRARFDGTLSPTRLAQALRHLAKWRARVLEQTLETRDGTTVQGGLFAGRAYDEPASEGAPIARLLGCCERTLAAVIKQIIARAYPVVLGIGCAEGNHAVGLAHRMPGTRVLAHDPNPAAQDRCARLAALDGVADRVVIGGAVDPVALARCAAQKTLILCEIEGADGALPDPAPAPALTRADSLVEVHAEMQPGHLATLTARGAPSHAVPQPGRDVDMSALPGWMEGLTDLVRLVALWEWRAKPAPWLWRQAHG